MTSFFRSMFFGGRVRRPVLVAPAFLAILIGMPLSALGQTTTGRILGSVHDSQDASVGGAKITVTDTQRNATRTTITDEGGDYVVPDLQPSTYKVLIEAKGFNSFQAPSILIEVGKDVRVDATLKTGDSTTVITVDEAAPMLDTTSYSLGGTLSNSEINDLPLNGRNYENLLQLRPGVVRYPGGGFSTTSSNGLRAEDNAYLVDGLFNSEPFSGQSIINGAGIAGDSATILPVDAIQEFNVIQNPPAEYGWKPGTMVNVGLKSGTNSLHGTAYGFGRTTALDARNYFNPVGSEKAPSQSETVRRNCPAAPSRRTSSSFSALMRASATPSATFLRSPHPLRSVYLHLSTVPAHPRQTALSLALPGAIARTAS